MKMEIIFDQFTDFKCADCARLLKEMAIQRSENLVELLSYCPVCNVIASASYKALRLLQKT